MSKKRDIPSKQTLNLVIKDRPPYYCRAILLGVLIGIILIGAFAKFAVIDRMELANRAKREAAVLQLAYKELVLANADFDEVREEHEKYFIQVDGDTAVDSMEVLRLIEEALMSNAAVQSAVFAENSLTVVLTGIDLEHASGIVKALYANELVDTVSLSSADTTVAGDESTVSMSITLTSIKEGDQ